MIRQIISLMLLLPLGLFAQHLETQTHYRESGKQYELKNHLGNVQATINEFKEPETQPDGHVMFTPNITSVNHYYAFGSPMPNSSFASDTYRYGFNGMEKDNEVKEEGNSYTTEFRLYDARVGRWLSLDPKMDEFPGSSPFVFSFNNPTNFNDPLGDAPPRDETVVGYAMNHLQAGSAEEFDQFITMRLTTTQTDNAGKLHVSDGISCISASRANVLKNEGVIPSQMSLEDIYKETGISRKSRLAKEPRAKQFTHRTKGMEDKFNKGYLQQISRTFTGAKSDKIFITLGGKEENRSMVKDLLYNGEIAMLQIDDKPEADPRFEHAHVVTIYYNPISDKFMAIDPWSHEAGKPRVYSIDLDAIDVKQSPAEFQAGTSFMIRSSSTSPNRESWTHFRVKTW